MKLRRIVAIVSIVAGGAGYKFGPQVWHQAQNRFESGHDKTVASAVPNRPAETTISTNSDGVRISNCDLGSVSLTNHCETRVSLGTGRDCLLAPKLVDSHNVELTLTVEAKSPSGKIHDLCITQVVAPVGKPLVATIGDFNFSFTPNLASE